MDAIEYWLGELGARARAGGLIQKGFLDARVKNLEKIKEKIYRSGLY